MLEEIKAKQRKEALDKLNKKMIEEASNKSASELGEMRLMMPPNGKPDSRSGAINNSSQSSSTNIAASSQNVFEDEELVPI